ncbi:MAG: hypothetical protein ACI865_001680 [Flavobacteriaceae bacterium]|jgi:hypothetical protein
MSHSNFKLPKTIDEVIAELDSIVKISIDEGSRMGYFAALYKRVTLEIKTKIDEGYFDDNIRMERLDVIFASRYLLAHHQYNTGEKCSTSWQLAFDSSKMWSPLVIQHLFVGMNAHIGLDLGIAASEVQPKNIASLHPDFIKINTVLGSLVNEVQDELASFFWPLKPIDWILGGIDEKIAKFAMDIARDEAWKFATAYAKLSNPLERTNYINARDIKVLNYSRKIVSPGIFINFLIRIFRGTEAGRVRYKIRRLNS